MAPTIASLFDHTCRVWRAVATKDGLGIESRGYAVVYEGGCCVTRSTAPVSPVGGGLAPLGRRRIYLLPDAVVDYRDILELVTGPETQQRPRPTWEVDEPPTRPRDHHTQCDVATWRGTLPAVS